MALPPKKRRGIAPGSRRGGWKAARKSLSKDERRVARVEKKDKTLEQLRRYKGLLEAAEDKNQQLSYIGKVTQLVYGFLPKPEQAEALWWLISEKKDLLLVAKTSFGKSLILQLLSCLIRDAIVLILLPLNAIGVEQMEKIQTLPGAQPIHLTANNNNNQTLAVVRKGYYSHILLSPEIACSQRFREAVLSDSKLRSRIKAVMVDEVHLVVDWGLTFRESYTHLKYLRNVLGHKPWFGCTATLDMQSFESLCHSSGFSKNVRIMRTTINRPEIAIIRKELPQNSKSSFRMLYFLFDEAVDLQDKPSRPTPERIKKSVIFFDSKSDIRSCTDTLRSWLEEKKGYTADEAKATIREYHATLSSEAKTWLYNEFKKPDSKIRILIATDALALGCNVADIEIIIQYGLPRRWNISSDLGGLPETLDSRHGPSFSLKVVSLVRKHLRTARGGARISILMSPISLKILSPRKRQRIMPSDGC
jgi:superfamily II DNA helicase RecQ